MPTTRISSDSALVGKKARIDFNAWALLESNSMPELTIEFLDFVLKLATSEITIKAEALYKHELAIFKDGVTL